MKIGERGQVTIPKKLRNKYGLMPHMDIELIPVEGGVLVKKRISQKSPVQEVYGILGKEISTDDYLEELRGR